MEIFSTEKGRNSVVDRVIPYEQKINGVCGPSCLAMCYRAFGESVSEEQLVGEIKPDLGMIDSKYFGGTLYRQLYDNARLHGYHAVYSTNVGYFNLEFLTQIKKLPVIVEWMTDLKMTDESDCHYSVVTYADQNKIKLADPSYGEFTTLPKREFLRKWRGFERDGSTSYQFGMVIWKG